MPRNKKEKVIAVRIEESLLEELEAYCKEYKINKSRLTRKALEKYMLIYKNESNTFNPLLIWNKVEFKYILSCLNDPEIEKLAEIAYESSINEFNRIIRVLAKGKTPVLHPKFVMGILENYVFSSEGFNWFDSIRSMWRDSGFIIAGTHKLGLNFSKYIKYRLIISLAPLSYKLTKETLQENKIVLDFNEKNEG